MIPILRHARRVALTPIYRLLYHEAAFLYDAISWLVSGGRWRRWTGVARHFVDAGPVLEIGCGPGHLLRALRRRGWRAIGVDRSRAMARQATSRNGPGSVVVAATSALPFRDAAFATVVSTFPAAYILEPATLAELRRVLQPAGRLIIVEGALAPARGGGRLVNRALNLVGSAAPIPAALSAAGFAVERWRSTSPAGEVAVTVGRLPPLPPRQ